VFPRTSRPGEKAARAQHDPALFGAHLLDLVDRDVHEPAPEEACAHGEERRSSAAHVKADVLDDAYPRRGPVDAEALAPSESGLSLGSSLVGSHAPMVPVASAEVGYAWMNPR